MAREQQDGMPATMDVPKPGYSGVKAGMHIPRPVKILSITEFKVLALWNTGEVRLNDFTAQKQVWKTHPVLHVLANAKAFEGIQIVDRTFTWSEQTFSFPDKPERKFPIDIDPIVCYNESELIAEFNPQKRVASMIRKARLKAGLTQAQLASRVGYSSKYISKIERGVTDIQFGSLEYILLVGLGQDLSISDFTLAA